jgi:DNA polymerase-3 subunit epsilon
MLAARRLYQEAPNHKLGSLVDYMNIPAEGIFHRALYDSEMTAKLWMAMLGRIGDRYEISEVSFLIMRKLTKTPKRSVEQLFEQR